jgi:N-methylhydantoinase A
MAVEEHRVRIGADVGGTFTDVILLHDDGRVALRKLPSTPADFAQAVLHGIDCLLSEDENTGATVRTVAHGTTVATNAVLERRGAKTALITTRGFRDVLELRRIRVPVLYDWFFDKPKELVDRHLRLEVNERIGADGQVLIPLQESELFRIKQTLKKRAVEAVAVCLLHSYAYPKHEIMIGEFLEEHLPEVTVSLSSEVLPERGEYERTATTVVNVYIQPVMSDYLKAMRRELRAIGVSAPLLIMQSAGGLTPEQEAALRPVFVLESGPAAGVLAARESSRRLGLSQVITLDMGGTTAKAAIIESGDVTYTPQYEVGAALSAGGVSRCLMGGGGELIRAPSIDIAEVGAGGGSIAFLDKAGGLHVGPRSAGAVPGPICYGKGGTEPTLTDANVVLGYIRPGSLADGQVSIDADAAHRAIHDHIAKPLGINLFEAALGIHRIANATTMRALREVSVQRGHDPRSFVLIAFGGSGPIHAAALAAELGIRETLVPPMPGLFSTAGLLLSEIEHHRVRSCPMADSALSMESLAAVRNDLQRELLTQFEGEGYPVQSVSLRCSVNMRFKGQASDISVALNEKRITEETVQKLCARFEQQHERMYGHRSEADNPIEVLAMRVVGRVAAGTRETIKPPGGSVHLESQRQVYFGEPWGRISTPVIAREAVSDWEAGPLLIDEYDSTIVVPPKTLVSIDEQNNVILRADVSIVDT